MAAVAVCWVSHGAWGGVVLHVVAERLPLFWVAVPVCVCHSGFCGSSGQICFAAFLVLRPTQFGAAH